MLLKSCPLDGTLFLQILWGYHITGTYRLAGITTGMTINRQAMSNLLHQENISYMISVRMNGETKKSIWCITNTIPSTNGVH